MRDEIMRMFCISVHLGQKEPFMCVNTAPETMVDNYLSTPKLVQFIFCSLVLQQRAKNIYLPICSKQYTLQLSAIFNIRAVEFAPAT